MRAAHRLQPAHLALAALAACGPAGDEEAASSAAPRGADRQRPHVLVVSIDTLRADRLSAYGYARPTSPRVAALAARGVRFAEAYSQAPCTAPAHMSLFTGMVPEAHGVRQWQPGPNERLSPAIPTLAGMLRSAGYGTEAYTGGGNVRPELGFDSGFDVYETHGKDVTAIFDGAVAALDRLAAGERPFLLFVHTFEAHDPYLPPAHHLETFAEGPYEGDILSDPVELAQATGFQQRLRSRVFWSRVDAEDPADLRHLHDLYDACIRHVDEQVGRLLDRLEALGVADDTLVVVTADHGEEFLEHGRFKHDTAYQELLHVPLVLGLPRRWHEAPQGAAPDGGPLLPRGLVVEGLARHVDVLPTLLELAGLPAPSHLQGSSLLPRLRGTGRPPEFVLSQSLHGRYHALRLGDWKLIRHEGVQQLTEQLYDLAADPGEQVDLIEARPEVAAHLRERLDALRAEARALRARFGSGQEVPLDDALREQLEALGYLGR